MSTFASSIIAALQYAMESTASSERATSEPVWNLNDYESQPIVNHVSSAFPDQTKRSRNAHDMLTEPQRYETAKWLTEQTNDEGKKCILSKAVFRFTQHFIGIRNANLARTLCYWNDRDSIVTTHKSGGKSGSGNFFYSTDEIGSQSLYCKGWYGT